MGAAPIGRPGWPEFAACTASMDSMRMALMALVSSSRSSAGRATADKRTSSNYGVGLGNDHACGEIFNWQGQGDPGFPVSIPCPGDATHEHVARPVPPTAAANLPELFFDCRVGRDNGFCHLPDHRKSVSDLIAAPLKIGERGYAEVGQQVLVAVTELS